MPTITPADVGELRERYERVLVLRSRLHALVDSTEPSDERFLASTRGGIAEATSLLADMEVKAASLGIRLSERPQPGLRVVTDG